MHRAQNAKKLETGGHIFPSAVTLSRREIIFSYVTFVVLAAVTLKSVMSL